MSTLSILPHILLSLLQKQNIKKVLAKKFDACNELLSTNVGNELLSTNVGNELLSTNAKKIKIKNT